MSWREEVGSYGIKGNNLHHRCLQTPKLLLERQPAVNIREGIFYFDDPYQQPVRKHELVMVDGNTALV